jgi:hypothetical protein
VRQIDRFCVATTFDIKDSAIAPDMLIVTNQPALGIGRQSCFAGSGQTKEQRCIRSGLWHRRGAMHWE